MERLLNAQSICWVGSQEISDKIFDSIANLVLSFLGVFWEAVDSVGDSDSIGINKRMRKESQSIENTTNHPNIYFVGDLVLLIGVHYLRRAIHGCSYRFNFLFDAIVLCFID